MENQNSMMNAQELRLKGLGKMIELKIDEMLEEKGRSAYWLAKETGVTEAAIWRLRHGKTSAIRFDTLEAICTALDCEPGDLIVMVKDRSKAKRKG